MQLITNAVPVVSRRGNDIVQRVFPGVRGTFGQHIVQIAVRLIMDFVKNEAGNIQAVLIVRICRQHLIESGVAVVHDAFSSGHDF